MINCLFHYSNNFLIIFNLSLKQNKKKMEPNKILEILQDIYFKNHTLKNPRPAFEFLFLINTICDKFQMANTLAFELQMCQNIITSEDRYAKLVGFTYHLIQTEATKINWEYLIKMNDGTIYKTDIHFIIKAYEKLNITLPMDIENIKKSYMKIILGLVNSNTKIPPYLEEYMKYLKD
jgi:hypothetical protein